MLRMQGNMEVIVENLVKAVLAYSIKSGEGDDPSGQAFKRLADVLSNSKSAVVVYADPPFHADWTPGLAQMVKRKFQTIFNQVSVGVEARTYLKAELAVAEAVVHWAITHFESKGKLLKE